MCYIDRDRQKDQGHDIQASPERRYAFCAFKFRPRLMLDPLTVDQESLTDPTSSVITPDVIRAYGKCGGDFAEAIPFCLLRAKSTFLRDANRNRECGDF